MKVEVTMDIARWCWVVSCKVVVRAKPYKERLLAIGVTLHTIEGNFPVLGQTVIIALVMIPSPFQDGSFEVIDFTSLVRGKVCIIRPVVVADKVDLANQLEFGVLGHSHACQHTFLALYAAKRYAALCLTLGIGEVVVIAILHLESLLARCYPAEEEILGSFIVHNRY